MNVASLMLKIIVCVHFFLSVWGCMSVMMPASYVYLHIGVLLCGLWSIGAPESTDAVVMMLVTLCFSILQDIILLGLYEPRAHFLFENGGKSEDVVNEYRFALGMCIVNLLLKPFSVFVLFRVYKTRNNESDFNIPGIDRIPGLGGMGGAAGYENIDNRPSAPYSGMPVETAHSHSTVVKE